MRNDSLRFLRDNSSTITALQRLLDSTLATGLLLAISEYHKVPFSQPYILLAAMVFLLILPVFKATGLYRSYRGDALTAEAPRILLGWGIVLATLLFLGYVTKSSAIFSRSILLSWAISVPFVLYIAHLSARVVLRSIRASGHNIRTAVVVGVTDVGRHLAEQFHRAPYLGIRFQGFFDDVAPDPLDLPKESLIGTLKELPEYVSRYRIDVVYIALPAEDDEALVTLIGKLQDTTACVYFVPNILMFNLMQARTYEVHGIPLIAVWEIPLSSLQHALKRLIDIVLASIVIIFLLPLMALIALGVKRSSPGPILFKQRRYGLNGREIIIYKFRSMKVMEDGDTISQATRNDSRTTRFGAFLRRTSLDELPQFINVLQGRMSIVGPRPHAVAHNEQYRKLISGYMLRHKVKPGITGWAQIHGLRGETDTLDKMKQRVEYDLQYLKNWSLGLDLMIIFKTALVFFQNHNAY